MSAAELSLIARVPKLSAYAAMPSSLDAVFASSP